jgi:hypothetical protein
MSNDPQQSAEADAQAQQPPVTPQQAQQAAPPPGLPPSVSALTTELIETLTARLIQSRNEHNNWIDPVMFNGSTVLVLFLTAAAAYLPSLGNSVYPWIAPLFAGLAGVFVAMERALGFGARWRYHRDMYYGYTAIIDMLAFYPLVPPNEQSKYARDIYTALYALRSRESAIPNAGTNTSPT